MGSSKNIVGFFGRNKAVFVMGLTALFIAATADLVAGLFLGSMEAYIVVIPGMMVLVYSAIGMRGNIFGAMGSRLGTSMHMGTFKVSLKKGTVLRANVESAIGLSFLVSLAMGVIGWAITAIFDFGDGDNVSIASFVFISMLGGLLAGGVLLGINLLIAWTGFRRNWDVDNITAPLIAAAGDIVTMPMLFICAWVVVNYGGDHQGAIIILTLLLILATALFLVYIFGRKIMLGRADEARRIISQSTPILLMCLMLDIAAGVIIENKTDMLFEGYLVLIILMPAFLNEGNALSGMLTARLSSMLHLGIVRPSKWPDKNARENFLINYVLAFITYGYIGVIAFVAAMLLGGTGDISFLKVMAIVLISGMIMTLAVNRLSYYAAIAAVRFDLDPDDHSIPITSSSTDLISAAVLISVIILLV